jgi:hypothetical protein
VSGQTGARMAQEPANEQVYRLVEPVLERRSPRHREGLERAGELSERHGEDDGLISWPAPCLRRMRKNARLWNPVAPGGDERRRTSSASECAFLQKRPTEALAG